MNFSMTTRSGRSTTKPIRYTPETPKKSIKKKSVTKKPVTKRVTTPKKPTGPRPPKRVPRVKFGPLTRQNYNTQMLANLFGSINMSSRCKASNGNRKW